MMHVEYVCLFVTLSGVLQWTALSQAQPEYREECLVWNNVTAMLSNEPKVNMGCKKNVQCTGFDCSGTYKYSGILNAGREITVDFCFGMAIHPCHSPLDMHFYVALPEFGSFFAQNVSDDDQVQLPGVHYDISPIGAADGFVQVDMDPTEIGGQKYVKLGMKFRMRITTTFGKFETWPDEFERTLMPDTYVPVPACDDNVITPNRQSHTCKEIVPPTAKPGGATKPHNGKPGTKPTVPPVTTENPGTRIPFGGVTTAIPSKPHTTAHLGSRTQSSVSTMWTKVSSKPHTTAQHGSRTPTSATTMWTKVSSKPHPTIPGVQTTPYVPKTTTPYQGKACVYSLAHGCEEGEMCNPPAKGEKEGVCGCMTGYTKAKGKPGCISMDHHDVIIPLPPHIAPEKPPKEASSHSTAIIIGGVVAGVALVAVVLVVIVIKYKKFQARYGQHDMLLNSDDDEPLDVAT